MEDTEAGKVYLAGCDSRFHTGAVTRSVNRRLRDPTMNGVSLKDVLVTEITQHLKSLLGYLIDVSLPYRYKEYNSPPFTWFSIFDLSCWPSTQQPPKPGPRAKPTSVFARPLKKQKTKNNPEVTS